MHSRNIALNNGESVRAMQESLQQTAHAHFIRPDQLSQAWHNSVLEDEDPETSFAWENSHMQAERQAMTKFPLIQNLPPCQP